MFQNDFFAFNTISQNSIYPSLPLWLSSVVSFQASSRMTMVVAASSSPSSCKAMSSFVNCSLTSTQRVTLNKFGRKILLICPRPTALYQKASICKVMCSLVNYSLTASVGKTGGSSRILKLSTVCGKEVGRPPS